MTTEDLLKPRYKVIADWPDPARKDSLVGHIYEWVENLHSKKEKWCSFYKKYPHLFKELFWYEKRTIEDFKSVKFVRVTYYIGYWRVGDIIEVEKFVYDDDNTRYGYNLKNKHFHPLTSVEPATKEEYENQKLQTT